METPKRAMGYISLQVMEIEVADLVPLRDLTR
jgi:hypothetical protein